jgi:hypothetical protein
MALNTIGIILLIVVLVGCGGECIRHSDCPVTLVCFARSCIANNSDDSSVDGGGNSSAQAGAEDDGKDADAEQGRCRRSNEIG